MYALGIDLGTTFTAAAIWRNGHAETASLGSRAASIPSVVLLREDETFLTGEGANRRGLTEPHRVAREFKRRLGDTTPILLGGVPYSAEALMARLLGSVVEEVSRREGGAPTAICVSHPANWGPYKTDLLLQAVRLAGLEEPVSFTTEPEAAAIFYAQQQRLEPGAIVAVYDLGGGTFDAAVLRKSLTGFEILGRPEGIERLGGIDFDAAVFHHVAKALGGKLEELDEDDTSVIAAVGRLREECVEAKEALSADTDVSVPVLLPNISTEVRLTRAELEAMVRPALYDSIEALKRALRSAKVTPDQLHSVLLVGGSSRMPVVSQLVGAELGRPVAVDAHPKHAVSLGAAWLASGALSSQPAPRAVTGSASVGGSSPVSGTARPVTPTSGPVSSPISSPSVSSPSVSSPPVSSVPGMPGAPVGPPVPVRRPIGEQQISRSPMARQYGLGDGSQDPTQLMGGTVNPGGPGMGSPAGMAGSAGSGGSAGVAGSGGSGGSVYGAAQASVPPVPRGTPFGRSAASGSSSVSGQSNASGASGASRLSAASGSAGRFGGRRGVVIAAAAVLLVLVAGGAVAFALTTGDDGPTPGAARTPNAGQTTPAPVASVAAAPPIPADEQCTDAIKANTRWVCLTKATMDGNTLTIEYQSNSGGNPFNINGGFHVHFYGANEDGSDPADSIEGAQASNHGNWYVEDKQPSVHQKGSSQFQAIAGHPKACGRIAKGNHELVPDNSGGGTFTTGNCIPITML